MHEKFPTPFASKLVPGSQVVITVVLNVRVTVSSGLNPVPFAVKLLDTWPTPGNRVNTGFRIVNVADPLRTPSVTFKSYAPAGRAAIWITQEKLPAALDVHEPGRGPESVVPLR